MKKTLKTIYYNKNTKVGSKMHSPGPEKTRNSYDGQEAAVETGLACSVSGPWSLSIPIMSYMM